MPQFLLNAELIAALTKFINSRGFMILCCMGIAILTLVQVGKYVSVIPDKLDKIYIILAESGCLKPSSSVAKAGGPSHG